MEPQQDTHLPTLYRLRLHLSSCYLITADHAVLVDAGSRGEGRSILQAIQRRGIEPADIRLIVLTHGHMDHAGAAREISAETGAPIALHAEDARWVSAGQSVPATPVTRWSRLISRFLAAQFIEKRMAMPPFIPDIILGDTDLHLEEYGIPAIAVYTPGHTAGSVSVLLPDGRAMVGDLAMNGFPALGFRPTPPIVAQDLSQLAESWRSLCLRGAKKIYPGHGAPFLTDSLQMLV